MKKNIIFLIGFGILLIVGVYYSVTSLSVVDNQVEDSIYDISCQSEFDCINGIKGLGIPIEKFNEALDEGNAHLVCNNTCGVELNE